NIKFIKTGSKQCVVMNTGTISVTESITSDKYKFLSSTISGKSSDKSEIFIEGENSVFSECVISNVTFPLTLEDYSNCFRSCEFNNVIFKGSAARNLKVNLTHKVLNNILFSGISKIYKSEFLSGLKFKDGKLFDADVIIEETNLHKASFENINFENKVSFVNCTINGLSFTNCNFRSDVYFTGCKITGLKNKSNSSEKSSFDGDIVFENCEIDDLSFENVKFSSSVKIINCIKLDNISINKADLKAIACSNENDVKVGINISQADLYGKIDLCGACLSKSGFTNITFKDENAFLNFENACFETVEFDHIEFEDFNFQKNLNFSNVQNWESIIKIDQPSLNYLKNIIYINNFNNNKFNDLLTLFLINNKASYFCLLHKVYTEYFISFNSFNKIHFGDIIFNNKYFLGCDFTDSTFNRNNFKNCIFLNCVFNECEQCDKDNKCRLAPCLITGINGITPDAGPSDDDFDSLPSGSEDTRIYNDLPNLRTLIEDHYDKLKNIFRKTDNYENNINVAFAFVNDLDKFIKFITACYQLFKEGAGDRYPFWPDIIDDINTLRNGFQHDPNHGSDRKIEKKIEEFNSILEKYNIFKIDKMSKNYSIAQLSILTEIESTFSNLSIQPSLSPDE
ncbi:MAG TPA: pentapeptide repeat-containing protein, partial [Candidatus Wallbacteria bacterium]|nr:pentapeptide repeat-containing protein [Candidatus Wallbacteria bacterium]